MGERLDWWESPRHRLKFMLFVASHAEQMHDSKRLLHDLRALIVAEECQPDAPTDEWRVPA